MIAINREEYAPVRRALEEMRFAAKYARKYLDLGDDTSLSRAHLFIADYYRAKSVAINALWVDADA